MRPTFLAGLRGFELANVIFGKPGLTVISFGCCSHPADGVFGSDKQSLPILIRVLGQVKLRIRSTPSQFALAQDALRRPFRSLERNLVLSHLVDGPALAGKEFHPSNI
jgi:hypothetical protein